MNISIGKRIQTFRKQKGMSQQDLSDYLGITRQAISKWELDQTLPDLETLVKMAELFEISLNELIGVEENSKSISELYDLMQNILNTQQKANKKRDFIQIITIILCVLSLLLNTFVKKESTHKPQPTDEPVISNSVISNMYEFTKDRFNQLKPNPYFTEESYIKVYYYLLDEMMVRITGKIYLNEFSEDTKVTIIFGRNNPYNFGEPAELKRDLSHSKNNEYILDTQINITNYDYVNLSIKHANGTTNFISLTDSIQLNYLSHVLLGHLNLFIPTNEDGQLQLDTLVFNPLLHNNTYGDKFWGLLDTNLKIELSNEQTGKSLCEFNVNMKEKTIYKLENPLPMNIPISIVFKMDVTYPYGDLFPYPEDTNIISTQKFYSFGYSFNSKYEPLVTFAPISFIVTNKNEAYRISELPWFYDQTNDTYYYEE